MVSMLAYRSDASNIEVGEEFLSFSNGGRLFQTGQVDEHNDEYVYVDFGDFRVRYQREHVCLIEENCGYIRSYYASRKEGVVVDQFV